MLSVFNNFEAAIRTRYGGMPDQLVLHPQDAARVQRYLDKQAAWLASLPTLEEVKSCKLTSLAWPRWLYQLLAWWDYRRGRGAKWRRCDVCGRGFGWRSEWSHQRAFKTDWGVTIPYCPGHQS